MGGPLSAVEEKRGDDSDAEERRGENPARQRQLESPR